jgi:hypothetical protein
MINEIREAGYPATLREDGTVLGGTVVQASSLGDVYQGAFHLEHSSTGFTVAFADDQGHYEIEVETLDEVLEALARERPLGG